MGVVDIVNSNPEQRAVLESIDNHHRIVVEALAGTGKTTVMKGLGYKFSDSGKKVLYLAFNREIVEETKRDVRGKFDCYTAHGFARRHSTGEVKKKFDETNGMFLRDSRAMKLLGIDRMVEFADVVIDGDSDDVDHLQQLSSRRGGNKEARRPPSIPGAILWDAVDSIFSHFQKSTEATITHEFVRHGIDRFLSWPWNSTGFQESASVVDYLVEKATDYWQRTIDCSSREFPLHHDTYLKLWQLTSPVLTYDVVLFDEAQDADPVMIDVIQNQRCAVVWCGDSQQQIYSWRGAVNTMSVVHRDIEFSIQTTQRFGAPIDVVANAFLALVTDKRIRPNPAIESNVVRFGMPIEIGPGEDRFPPVDLEIFRSNVKLLMRFIKLAERNVKVSVLADLRRIEALLEDLRRVLGGETAQSSALASFSSFLEVVAFVNRQKRRQAKNPYAVMPDWIPASIALLDLEVPKIQGYFVEDPSKFGTGETWKRLSDAVKSAVEVENPDVTLATAHKSKGLSADTVRVDSDFALGSLYEDSPSVERAIERIQFLQSELSNEEMDIVRESIRLSYVAVTRARRVLVHPFAIDSGFDKTGMPQDSGTSVADAPASKFVDSGGGPTVALPTDLPAWAGDVMDLMRRHDLSPDIPERMNYRYRFVGWTTESGVHSSRFDVIFDKYERPTTIQTIDDLPASLAAALDGLVRANSAIGGADLPPVNENAKSDMLRIVDIAGKNGTALDWSAAEHQWQIRLWEVGRPSDVVYLQFGKKGVNTSHVPKTLGDPAQCRVLVGLAKVALEDAHGF